jgi:hypothetical protein
MSLYWGYWKTDQGFWNDSPLKYPLHGIIPYNWSLTLRPCIEATERRKKDVEMIPLTSQHNSSTSQSSTANLPHTLLTNKRFNKTQFFWIEDWSGVQNCLWGGRNINGWKEISVQTIHGPSPRGLSTVNCNSHEPDMSFSLQYVFTSRSELRILTKKLWKMWRESWRKTNWISISLWNGRLITVKAFSFLEHTENLRHRLMHVDSNNIYFSYFNI